MLILLDYRAPEKARKKLQDIGEVVSFKTEGICYDAVSGHPDIFLFQHPCGCIMAPNIPEFYKKTLLRHSPSLTEGSLPVGISYPQTAHYNALYTENGVLHNKKFSDPELLKFSSSGFINCQQGYVRCTTIQIGSTFFTSDKGIERTLLAKAMTVFYIDPQNIVLQGVNNGFFGGCCGVWEKNIYFCGALKYFQNHHYLVTAIENQGFNIIELYNGPIIDVGSILFFP